MISQININVQNGLSSSEAARRLKKYGLNQLPSEIKRSIFSILFSIILEPMFLLLIVGGILYLILGSKQEAIMLLGFVVFIIIITFYQERKTERALEALRNLSCPRALVIRDGKEIRIAGREVVYGDIVVLREGDSVPADAVLLMGDNLLVDESLLTGESVPVRKIPDSNFIKKPPPGGEDLPFVYSGTLVVRGYGVAEVTATGIDTELGKIGGHLKSIQLEKTKLQKETNRLVKNFATIGLLLCALIVVIYGLTRADWLHGFLAGITLAMAILPEEFPVVLVVFLALGAWRISQKKVLTRQVPAIEALGAATVLCVDKTGTLTLNKMTVSELYANKTSYEIRPQKSNNPTLPEQFHELVEYSILASQRDPFDPTEKAFKNLGDQYLEHTEHLHEDWKLMRQYPLSKELLAISHVWQSPGGIDFVIAAKGAPEAITDLCHLSEIQCNELSKQIKMMASKGLRVLGVAKAQFKKENLPNTQHDFEFQFVGLIGLSDPIRPEVPEAIQSCYRAGIKVIMMTGDYPATAKNIAHSIGLKYADKVITGIELNKMSNKELEQQIKTTNVFARIIPEQKLRLINALKANNEIVAMTGDGVNDAPALKAADIGIAMGARGTDVARESSSLVLLDDNFTSIINAIKLGRRIFDNIKKAISYIFAIHIPIAGISLIPVLFNWPLIFYPVHIVFLELIIDPACSIAFEAEPEEDDIMDHPPREPQKPLFSKKILGLSFLQGLSVLTITMIVFEITRHIGHSVAEARTLTFTTLVIANIGLIFANRSWTHIILTSLKTKNKALWMVVVGTLCLLASVLYIPFLRNLFDFEILHFMDLLVCLIAGFISIIWFEFLKLIRKQQRV